MMSKFMAALDKKYWKSEVRHDTYTEENSEQKVIFDSCNGIDT